MAITAGEFDALDITAQDFHDFNITAGEFDNLTSADLLEMVKQKLEEFQPQENEDNKSLLFKEMALALVLNLASSVIYDEAKAVDWSSVLRYLIELLS